MTYRASFTSLVYSLQTGLPVTLSHPDVPFKAVVKSISAESGRYDIHDWVVRVEFNDGRIGEVYVISE